MNQNEHNDESWQLLVTPVSGWPALRDAAYLIGVAALIAAPPLVLGAPWWLLLLPALFGGPAVLVIIGEIAGALWLAPGRLRLRKLTKRARQAELRADETEAMLDYVRESLG